MCRRYELLRRLHIPDTAHQVGTGGNGLSPVVHLLPLADELHFLTGFQGLACS